MANVEKLTIGSDTYDLRDALAVHTVDSTMSSSSTNPVQNKVAKAYVDDAIQNEPYMHLVIASNFQNAILILQNFKNLPTTYEDLVAQDDFKMALARPIVVDAGVLGNPVVQGLVINMDGIQRTNLWTIVFPDGIAFNGTLLNGVSGYLTYDSFDDVWYLDNFSPNIPEFKYYTDDAITTLQSSLNYMASGLDASKTITVAEQSDGLLDVSAEDIAIVSTQVEANATEAATPANGDGLIFADSDDANKLKRMTNGFGTSTTTFLRNDGTWAAPPSSEAPVARIFHGTCSVAAAAKTVVCPQFLTSDFVTGAIVFVTFTVTNTGAVGDLTLNVNGTGAKNIKYMRNAAESNLPDIGYLRANMTYRFVYNGTYWVCDTDYDADTVTQLTYRTMRVSSATGGGGLVAYVLCALDKENDVIPFNSITHASTKTTTYNKAQTTAAFDPFRGILYYSGTTAVAVGSGRDANEFKSVYQLDVRYCLNINSSGTAGSTALTAYDPVYIKALYNTTTRLATLTTNLSSSNYLERSSIVQSLPSSDPNSGLASGTFYIYILLGQAYSKYQLNLYDNNLVYYWNTKAGMITEFTGIIEANYATGSGISGYLAKWTGMSGQTATELTVGPMIGTGTTKYLREDGTWVEPSISVIKNDLTLLKEGTTPGDSHSLIFQRGTLTDNYNDWRIQDRGGFLYFDQRGSGSSSWGNMASINTSGTLTASSFSGSGASLTSLNASNISSGTLNAARLPSGLEYTSNKTQYVNHASTTAEYPSAKAVYDALDAITYKTGDQYYVWTPDQTPAAGKLVSGSCSQGTYSNFRNAAVSGKAVFVYDDAEIFDYFGDGKLKLFTLSTDYYETSLDFFWEGSCEDRCRERLTLWGDDTFELVKWSERKITQFYGDCTTAASTAAKVVSVTGDNEFKLEEGVRISVRFTNGSTSASTMSLNVDGTGAKNCGVYLYNNTWQALTNRCDKNAVLEFMYDGTYWIVLTPYTLRNFGTCDARLTSANRSFQNYGLEYFLATSSMTTGKPPVDAAILGMHWDNGNIWGHQLAVGNGTGRVFTRAQNGTTNWSDWRELPRLSSAPSNGDIIVSDDTTGVGLVKGVSSLASTSITSDATESSAVETGDGLMFADSSDSNKLKRMTSGFDVSNNTSFLRQDGVWAVPAGGGGGTSGIFKGTCGTGAAGDPKVVQCPEFTSEDLVKGAVIFVTFTYTNSASVNSVQMNVNGTGAKRIMQLKNTVLGTMTTNGELVANQTYMFTYDGTYWVLSNDDDRTNVAALGNGHKNIGTTNRYQFLVSAPKDDTNTTDHKRALFAINAVDTGSTVYTKAFRTWSFDPFGVFAYWNSADRVSSEGTFGDPTRLQIEGSVAGNYGFNLKQNGTAGTQGLVDNKAVYMKSKYNFETQTATLWQDTASANYLDRSGLVQELPTTNPNTSTDTYIYIYLGQAFGGDARTFYLLPYHPVYMWNEAKGRMDLFTGGPMEGSGTCTLTDGDSFSFTANYHKIGKQVTIYGTIPTGGSANSVSGLPFTASAAFSSQVMFQSSLLTSMVLGKLSVASAGTSLSFAGFCNIGSMNTMSAGSWLGQVPSAGVPFNFTYITDVP